MYKTSFSKEVVDKLKAAGADDGLLLRLAQRIDTIPRGRFDVDTSDNCISCFDIPVSFIRDHIKHETMVMTNQEAWNLDSYSRLSGLKKSRRMTVGGNGR